MHLDPGTKQTLKLDTYHDVIVHFTASSLAEDGIQIRDGSLSVTNGDGSAGYTGPPCGRRWSSSTMLNARS
jgi:hypothetical protein